MRLPASLAPKRRFTADSNRSPPCASDRKHQGQNSRHHRIGSHARIGDQGACGNPPDSRRRSRPTRSFSGSLAATAADRRQRGRPNRRKCRSSRRLRTETRAPQSQIRGRARSSAGTQQSDAGIDDAARGPKRGIRGGITARPGGHDAAHKHRADHDHRDRGAGLRPRQRMPSPQQRRQARQQNPRIGAAHHQRRPFPEHDRRRNCAQQQKQPAAEIGRRQRRSAPARAPTRRAASNCALSLALACRAGIVLDSVWVTIRSERSIRRSGARAGDIRRSRLRAPRGRNPAN